jgi:hypothetical protein
MENKKLQNGIEDINKITMTSLEKKRILENIYSSSSIAKKPLYSPWMTYSFISILNKKSLVYFVIIPLILVLTGGGVVFASEDSLPDSILYPIKVNVMEPIKGALTFSPEAKALYESNLATKRLVEAETLANQGKLDKSNEKVISNLLERHTTALNKAITETKETKASAQVDEIVTDFQAGMNAHARVLDIVAAKNDNSNNPNNDNIISNVARVSAQNIRTTLNNNDASSNDNNQPNKYSSRKNSIQSLLNNTTIDINNTDKNNSPVKEKIINDTNTTIDQAKNYLNEADKNEKAGNAKDAYSSLLNSESSIKEANIFLKAGLKFKGNNNSNNGMRGNHK